MNRTIKNKRADERPNFDEQYRPQFHFSPPENWMNDPNGLVYFCGKYHLFYQYNPHGDTWGNMNWGHASSADLLHWDHHPIAISPGKDEFSYVFSGGAVVDFNNSSGLAVEDGNPALIAFFTHSGEACENQRQSIAYSIDEGKTWTEYDKNPILENPGIVDFRDPKVHWDSERGQWIMCVAAGKKAMFYRSQNLLEWSFVSEFGLTIGSEDAVWECPDLIELTADDGVKRHILIISINPGGPDRGSGTKYFVGKFDGKSFVPDQAEAYWLDWGWDSYAGITWDSEPGALDRTLLIAWMSNWDYANELPTAPWRGQMTIVRSLELIKSEGNGGYKLSTMPINELEKLYSNDSGEVSAVLAEGDSHNLIDARLSDIELTINADTDGAACVLCYYNLLGERLEIYVDFDAQKYLLDRSQAGVDKTGKDFCSSFEAPFSEESIRSLDLRVLKDVSSIECFAENGKVSMTALVFATENLDLVKIQSVRGQVSINANCRTMTSIWT